MSQARALTHSLSLLPSRTLAHLSPISPPPPPPLFLLFSLPSLSLLALALTLSSPPLTRALSVWIHGHTRRQDTAAQTGATRADAWRAVDLSVTLSASPAAPLALENSPEHVLALSHVLPCHDSLPANMHARARDLHCSPLPQQHHAYTLSAHFCCLFTEQERLYTQMLTCTHAHTYGRTRMDDTRAQAMSPARKLDQMSPLPRRVSGTEAPPREQGSKGAPYLPDEGGNGGGSVQSMTQNATGDIWDYVSEVSSVADWMRPTRPPTPTLRCACTRCVAMRLVPALHLLSSSCLIAPCLLACLIPRP